MRAHCAGDRGWLGRSWGTGAGQDSRWGLEKGRAVIGDRRWAVMGGRRRSGPARAVTAVGPETNILDVAITRLCVMDVLSGQQSLFSG